MRGWDGCMALLLVSKRVLHSPFTGQACRCSRILWHRAQLQAQHATCLKVAGPGCSSPLALGCHVPQSSSRPCPYVQLQTEPILMPCSTAQLNRGSCKPPWPSRLASPSFRTREYDDLKKQLQNKGSQVTSQVSLCSPQGVTDCRDETEAC